MTTACPFCLVMLRDGLADASGGRGEGIGAQDISEVLAASLPARHSSGRDLPVIQRGA